MFKEIIFKKYLSYWYCLEWFLNNAVYICNFQVYFYKVRKKLTLLSCTLVFSLKTLLEMHEFISQRWARSVYVTSSVSCFGLQIVSVIWITSTDQLMQQMEVTPCASFSVVLYMAGENVAASCFSELPVEHLDTILRWC